MKKIFLLFNILLFSVLLLFAERFFNPLKYPKGSFSSPVKIPLSLAGNFGECRPNHFHSGLDVRTNKVENIPIYSIGDGFVSRIKIEANGFGNAIYITHNNGYVSLYAHLNKFWPELETYVRTQQYKQKTWKIDLTPSPLAFPVTKGQFIAFSGNTGSSQAPHLHMEIRDVKTDKPLNGLLFYNLTDTKAPIVKKIAVYDVNRSIYDQSPKQFNCLFKGGVNVPRQDTIVCNTNYAGIGIVADDPMENALGVLGVFEMNMFVDGKQHFGWQLDNIGYEETRYMNAMADYRVKKNGGPWIQLCYKLDGDKLNIYKSFSRLNGRIFLDDGKAHKVEIITKDVNGNSSKTEFWIRSNLSSKFTRQYNLKALQENKFDNGNISFVMPPNLLYDDIPFQANISNSAQPYSHMYQVHFSDAPLHDYFNLKLKTKANIPSTLYNKIAVIKYPYGKDKDKKGYAATTTDGSWVIANVREFGTYEIVIDNTPPTISGSVPAILTTNKIAFTAKDETTRVQKFTGKIDGNWVRFVQKGNNYTYEVDQYCSIGNHQLEITAIDENGNSKSSTFAFLKK
jgi:hypothetical protein